MVTAGTFSVKSISEGSVAEWNSVLNERVIGALVAVQAAMPHMTNDGSITLTSGGLARRPTVGAVPIASTMAGIEVIARGLAIEVAPVRVNAVAPGWIDTPLADCALGEHKQNVFSDLVS